MRIVECSFKFTTKEIFICFQNVSIIKYTNCFLSYNGKEWANKQTNNHITHTNTETNKTNKTNKQNKSQQSEQFQNLIENLMKKEKSISLITHIHDRSVFYFGTGTSIKSSNVKLVLYVQTSPVREMMRSCK